MLNIGRKIQSYISMKNSRKKFRVLAVLMSAAVMLSVVSSLIKPAISVTDPESLGGVSNVSQTRASGDEGDSGTGAYDFGSEITNAYFQKSDQQGDNPDSVDGMLVIEYQLAPGFISEGNIITYQLPDNIIVGEDSRSGEVTITGTVYKGAYTISETGLITIAFRTEFLDGDEDFRHTGISGDIRMGCSVTRGSDNNDDKVEVNIGKYPVSVDFEVKKVNLKKEGKLQDDGTILWTLNVYNPMNEDLNGLGIVDSNIAAGSTVTVKDSAGADIAATVTDGKVTLNGSVSSYPVTLTYSTSVDFSQVSQSDIIKGGGTNKNTASLTAPPLHEGQTQPIEVDTEPVTGTATLPAYVTMEKSGALGSGDKSDEITWTISLSAKEGFSYDLNNLVLTDEAFAKLSAGDLTVGGGLTYELDAANKKLTLNGTLSGNTEITYKTTASSDADYQNTVNAYGDYEHNPWNADKSADATVLKAVSVSKTGSAVNGSGYIQWTITIRNNDPQTIPTLDGYKVTDSLLNTADIVGISAGSLGEDGVISGTNGATEVVITYATKAEIDPATESSKPVNNKVGISKDGVVADSDEFTVSYNRKLDKNKSHKAVTESTDSNGNAVITIPWKVSYNVENGSLLGETVSDTMTIGSDNAKLLSLSNFRIKYQTMSVTVNDDGTVATVYGEWTEMPAGSYALSADIDAKQWTCHFTDDILMKNVAGVEIEYDAVVDISAFKTNENVDIDFANRATLGYDDSIAPDSFVYTVQNEIPYVKYGGYDPANGSVLTDLAGTVNKPVDQIEKIEINGEPCYLFRWAVILDESYYSKAQGFTFTDTLPGGMKLYEADADINKLSYHQSWGSDEKIKLPALAFSSTYNSYAVAIPTDGHTYSYDADAGIITFNINGTTESGTRTIYYNTYMTETDYKELLKASSDGKVSMTNSFVQTGSGFRPSELVTVITPDRSAVVNKTMLKGSGIAQYTVTFNLDSANLTDGDYVSLFDTLVTDGADKGSVGVDLSSIRLYKYVADTANHKGEEVTDFVYNFDNSPAVIVNPYTDWTIETDEKAQWWTKKIFDFAGELDPNVEYEFNVSGPANQEAQYYFKGTYGEEIQGGSGKFNFDSNGKYKLTVSGLSGIKKLELDYNGECDFDMSATVKTHDYAAKLNFKVPDETPLIIEYKYVVHRDGTKNGSASVSNTITVDSAAVENASSTCSDVIELSDYSSASARADIAVSLRKTDSVNGNMLLDAGFKLARYNSYTKKWEYAKDLSWNTESNWYDVGQWNELGLTTLENMTDGEIWSLLDGSGADTINTDSAEYNLKLNYYYTDNKGTPSDTSDDENYWYIYMIIESRAPEGYIQLKKPIYVCFYNYLSNLKGVAADAGVDISDIQTKMSERFDIKNTKSVTVSTTKSWSALPAADKETAYASFTLMRSHTQSAKGLPDDLTAVSADDLANAVLEGGLHGISADSVKLKAGESCTWSGLPYMDSEGNEWYYYFKETSYTVGGIDYVIGDENAEYSPEYTLAQESDGEQSKQTVGVSNKSDNVKPPEPVTLPETGGSGREGFLILGLLAAIAAAAALRISKGKCRGE